MTLFAIMANSQNPKKPSYRILGRFVKEFIRFAKANQIPWRSLVDFPAYHTYNRALKSHAEVGLPWIAQGALEHLDSYLDGSMTVLEFGCGGSTLYFSRKVGTVISIEDNQKWFEIMKEKTADFSGVDLRWIPEDEFFQGEKYLGNSFSSKEISFKNYVQGAADLKEESIDVLVVDGRSRIPCLTENLPKLKKEGLILFDNSDRKHYQEGLNSLLKGWERIDYSGVTVHDWMFSQTSIFRRSK